MGSSLNFVDSKYHVSPWRSAERQFDSQWEITHHTWNVFYEQSIRVNHETSVVSMGNRQNYGDLYQDLQRIRTGIYKWHIRTWIYNVVWCAYLSWQSRTESTNDILALDLQLTLSHTNLQRWQYCAQFNTVAHVKIQCQFVPLSGFLAGISCPKWHDTIGSMLLRLVWI